MEYRQNHQANRGLLERRELRFIYACCEGQAKTPDAQQAGCAELCSATIDRQ